MNYNAIISAEDITDESGAFEEPVSIDEMKDYLRLEGFVDTDESPSTELSSFNFDDRLIADMIKGARQLFEEAGGMTLIPKTWSVVLTNLCGMQELPYGPVISITSVKDSDGVDLDYTITGSKRVYLKTPLQAEMTIVYEAGYDEIPKAIKIDIMRLVTYTYENRGDDAAIQKFGSQLAKKYSRRSFIN